MVIANPPLAEPVIDPGGVTIKPPFEMGVANLVIELIDNGTGMSRDTIINHFWNLGDSKSRGNQYAIGEKGHGTKIYLRSDKVLVQTNDGIDSYETECEGAFFSLNAGEVHSPKVRKSDQSFSKGTHIRIEGYNNNQRSTLKQDILKDYLYWYTILGTIENQFPNRQLREFKFFCKH